MDAPAKLDGHARKEIMMIEGSPAVYQLFWGYDHLHDEKFDAALVRFAGWEQVAGWQSTRSISTPDKIYFEANFKTLAQTDYPANNVSWPLMSRRMLETLLSQGSFKHRIIPVVMLDNSLPAGKRLDSAGHPLPGAANLDYSALQLLETADYLDWERSEYKQSKVIPNVISQISKLVLKEPPGGFPPVFRLAAKSNYLFVSARTKQALEEAGIRGVQFWTIDKIRV